MYGAYYNDNDVYAAQWLRNLIKAGHIADGEVDERSIADVCADDLKSYAQCHFFAGIGGWSYALRLAGWPDDRPVWTGSCPCQPFSVAGQRKGLSDERHLWPTWFPLIAECRPPTIFGEQVDAAVRGGWLDAVFADLEREDYACGAAVLPACGVGSPHIRKRLWFVGYAESLDRRLSNWQERREDSKSARPSQAGKAADSDDFGGMDNAAGSRCIRTVENSEGKARNETWLRLPSEPSAWRDIEWLPCADGKARPVEPGTFPLAHGISNRVGRLRAYGNAIVPQAAAEFIRCSAGACTHTIH